MRVHLQREIENLKKMVLALSARVEESVEQAARAIALRDTDLAREVIEEDYEIDQREVEVEEECLKILALHQPVAIDLRYIIAILKINSDLERIGDLATNVAQGCIYLDESGPADFPFDFPRMAQKAQDMVNDSLDALVNRDPELARDVCLADDEVDEINRQMYGLVDKAMRENPEHSDGFLRLLTVSHHLERIADHATNIAEDVIYMSEGDIVRHAVSDEDEVS
ncbi:MAG: phosphate signaling complex protein PhoU [Planctomycetota bacterium]